jgi:hypothetical protein
MTPKGFWGFVAFLAAAAVAQHLVDRKPLPSDPDRGAMIVAGALKDHLPALQEGLAADQKIIQERELRMLLSLDRIQGFSVEAYINRYGEVRWHGDAALIGRTFDALSSAHPPRTDALEQSYIAKAPRGRPIPGDSRIEVAVPVVSSGTALGALLVEAELPGKGGE